MDVKQLWCEADHSPESSVEVTTKWSFPLDVYVAGGGTTTLWCVICELHVSVLFICIAEILTSIHLYMCIFFLLRNAAICMMVSVIIRMLMYLLIYF